MIVENTFTVNSIDANVAFIDVSSIISINTDVEPLDLIFAKISYALSGEQDGVIEYDVKTGWVIKSTVTQSLSGDMIMSMEGEEMIIPMSVESITIVELLD